MRNYLLPEYQESIQYSFPVTVDALEKQAEEALKPQTYIDENGEEQIAETITVIGGEEVKIPQTTKEDTDFVINFLKSLKDTARYDQQLLNIISEETAPYFKGQKSVEEVMDIIQNRAQMYINEQG